MAPGAPPPVLRLNDLHKQFGEVHAVNGVSLAVAPGEVVGLVGPDGAGKTTTMRMVAGLLTPNAGNVEVLGQELAAHLHALRPNIGYMPQHYSLYGDLSVQENLRFFAGMYGVPHDLMIEREARLLGIARLDEFRGRAAGALSGGMYKKLALSCALIHEPRLLLLDEPTNGVDPLSRRELWHFLGELVSEGVGVLISTPYMDEAERCGRVGLLVEGELVALDRPAALEAGFDATVFDVGCADHVRALGLLAEGDGVDQVYAVGRRLHVVSHRGPAFAAQIEATLAAAELGPSQIEVVAPSFEDIFIHLSVGAQA